MPSVFSGVCVPLHTNCERNVSLVHSPGYCTVLYSYVAVSAARTEKRAGCFVPKVPSVHAFDTQPLLIEASLKDS
jgi:hypothetical protein